MVTVDVSTGKIVERFQTSSFNSAHLEAFDDGGLVRPEAETALDTPAQAVAKLLAASEKDSESTRRATDDEATSTCSVQAIHCVKSTAEQPLSNSDLYLNPIRESFDTGQVGQDLPTSLLKPVGDGTLITVGQDRIVRLWNLGRPSQSFVVSGSGKDALKRYK